MRKQVRSILCGCGDCAIRRDVSGTCPQATSKDAIWLWHSDPKDTGSISTEEFSIDEIMEVFDEVAAESTEVVL